MPSLLHGVSSPAGLVVVVLMMGCDVRRVQVLADSVVVVLTLLGAAEIQSGPHATSSPSWSRVKIQVWVALLSCVWDFFSYRHMCVGMLNDISCFWQ